MTVADPSSLDIGYCCEEVLIEIFKLAPQLAALNIVHADTDSDTEIVRVTVKAESVRPEAPNPRTPQLNVRRIEMRVQVRASLGQMPSPALHSAYGQICQIIENLDGPTYSNIAALSYFTYLVPTLDLENSRENDEQRRKLTKTFTFLGILSSVQSLP